MEQNKGINACSDYMTAHLIWISVGFIFWSVEFNVCTTASTSGTLTLRQYKSLWEKLSIDDCGLKDATLNMNIVESGGETYDI